MSKQLLGATAICVALFAATPALADRGHHKKHHGNHHARHAVVYHDTRYVPAPRVVYYRAAPAAYYSPRPVYVEQRPYYNNGYYNGYNWIAGAMVLGAVLHHADHHR